MKRKQPKIYTVHHKYKVGDNLIGITERYEQVECPSCKGCSEIKFNGGIYECKSCHGTGKVSSDKKKWSLNDKFRKVDKVKIIKTENEYKVEYYTNNIYNDFIGFEENVFLTKEEAQKECDKRK